MLAVLIIKLLKKGRVFLTRQVFMEYNQAELINNVVCKKLHENLMLCA